MIKTIILTIPQNSRHLKFYGKNIHQKRQHEKFCCHSDYYEKLTEHNECIF